MRSSGPKPPPPPSWFASGKIDRRKLEDYLLSPTHPDGRHKLRLWDSVFGIGVGDGKLLERLIRQQVASGEVTERPPRIDARRFGVVIPDFEGPAGPAGPATRGPVLTAWASDHGDYKTLKPRLVTAFPIVE
jgi:hypothetical protein